MKLLPFQVVNQEVEVEEETKSLSEFEGLRFRILAVTKQEVLADDIVLSPSFDGDSNQNEFIDLHLKSDILKTSESQIIDESDSSQWAETEGEGQPHDTDEGSFLMPHNSHTGTNATYLPPVTNGSEFLHPVPVQSPGKVKSANHRGPELPEQREDDDGAQIPDVEDSHYVAKEPFHQITDGTQLSHNVSKCQNGALAVHVHWKYSDSTSIVRTSTQPIQHYELHWLRNSCHHKGEFPECDLAGDHWSAASLQAGIPGSVSSLHVVES